MLLNLRNSGTADFRILTSYWLAGGGEAYFIGCFDEVACPTVFERRKLYRKNAELIEPQNPRILRVGSAPGEAQATFGTCRDQTLESAGRKSLKIHNIRMISD